MVDFSISIWKDCPDTVRSIVAYIIFYQVGPINYVTHVPGPVTQSISEIDYNTACTAGMALAHFRMLIHELLNNDPYIVPDKAPMIILDGKSDVCMANNGKYIKYTSHISRTVYFVINIEKCKVHKIDWCEGGMQFSEIST